jgi:YD repeat-containing protein
MALAFLHSKSARVLCLAQILCFLLLFPVTGGSQSSNEIVYVYDELGRLVAVIDTAGEAAVYNYDAVGNLLSISRYSASVVSIIEFTPNSGPVGTTVAIWGTGFSTTPSQNTVTFNGVAATVTAATSTKITTTVPAGATTGPIAITTPAGNATSSTSFVVGGSGLPTITNFTPTIGVAGTAVTITGTNFETTAVNNKSKFNLTYSSITSATSTTIATAVPANSTSGRLTVSTPAGTAVSTNDFFVPPPPFGVADVAVTDRMAFGESKTVTLSTANKIGLILFDATALQKASIKVNSFSMTNANLVIYKPNGDTLLSTSIANGNVYDTPVLAANGTYTILIDPTSTNTGSINFTLHNSTDATGTISPGGAAVTATTTTPGQNVRLTFNGTAGQRVSLKITNSTYTGCTAVRDYIMKPDNTTLDFITLCSASGFLDTVVLPVTGTYTILVDPQGATTGSQTLTLYDVPADVTGTITPGGAAVTVTTTVPGQNARLTFSGTASQRVSLQLSNTTFTGCLAVKDWILKPDGTTLTSETLCSAAGFIDAVTLPVSGTYTILVDPQATTTGSQTLALNDVPADVTGTITPGGAAVTVTTTVPGQNARLTFSGTASQRVSLQLSNTTFTGCLAVKDWILKPDGTTLTSETLCSAAGFIDAFTLPVSGTYTILIDPQGATVGSQTLLLNDAADVTGTMTVGGSALTLTTTAAGQNAMATFSGTSGQQISVAFTNSTMGTVTVTLFKPDGTTLTSTTSASSSVTLPTQTLPATGTYSIKIDPSGTSIGSITLAVTEVTSSATLQADYQFQNSRSSSVGSPPALTDLGTNSFTTATVDGTSRTVLSFAQNNGLSLSPTTGVVGSNTYSIVMLFSVSTTSSFRRIADFKNGTSDTGLYVVNGKLYLYNASQASSVSIAANTYVQVVLTRDSAGTITGYVDGVQQIQFADSGGLGSINSSNTLRFFRDDGTEASAGAVARIRLYDDALTASQVTALSRLP